ncbi:hypothetical protein B296_00040295 [Ensete ventricosum]|uniref:MLO-like protein n=1 Tax=Ensete ventricosum TaxID=4639 RepID=A0A426ZR01_ENSVE|nr:hypothetical protein B296_00040295 [Ensete ventricosum]
MSTKLPESRSLALTPTWSVAAVLTIFVAVSLLVERSIHRLSSWLKKTHRNPLFEALEKMKEGIRLFKYILGENGKKKLVEITMIVMVNHNLTSRYDFHSYMIRSMEEEFKRIVGVRLVDVFDCTTVGFCCCIYVVQHK